MRTTFDDIPELGSLGPAEPVAAPSNVFTNGDTLWPVLYAAFRAAIADGREPHGVIVKFESSIDIEAVLPPDAEVVRSATDDEDTALLAKGLGYSILISTLGPTAYVSAASRAHAKALASDLRERAGAAQGASDAEAIDDVPLPGQYL